MEYITDTTSIRKKSKTIGALPKSFDISTWHGLSPKPSENNRLQGYLLIKSQRTAQMVCTEACKRSAYWYLCMAVMSYACGVVNGTR